MKKIFEQPKLQVQTFAVEDQLLTASGWGTWDLGGNETNVLNAINGDSIVKRQN